MTYRGENFIMMNFIACILHRMLLGGINRGGCGGWGMWHASGMGENVYRVLIGSPEGRSPLGTPRLRWEDNIQTDLSGDRDRWGELDSAGLG
jgi:hypothetical protein